MDNDQFSFNISLSVLNHLGRNLYRNFATVIGEAVSNAWDANAENVWITIDRNDNKFWIKDDGIGMDATDFRDKFLKIGYSKRRNGDTFSSRPHSRPYIGNKGIGKLALLSCAQRISVISKKSAGENYIGGCIDNSSLDAAITDDLSSHDYLLTPVDISLFEEMTEGHTQGTIICFEQINEGIHRTDDFLKKIIALYFRFSLLDESFNIYLDNELVTLDALDDISSNTQFIWNINNWQNDPFIDLCTSVKEIVALNMETEGVAGFIASVRRPKNRNIHSTGEKVGVDLFVNGRVRETDVLKHIPSSRIPESYLYGQIHFNTLDSDGVDRFTSSREGILADDPLYKSFLDELRQIVRGIMDQWNDLREKYNEDGDPDNTQTESSKFKKAKSLYRDVAKAYSSPSGESDTDDFLVDLTADAAFNSESYVECFISENILRRQISIVGPAFPIVCQSISPDGKTCPVREKENSGGKLCVYCKAEGRKSSLQGQKLAAKISIPIRVNENDSLMYLDYVDLAHIINNPIINAEYTDYSALRNSVMHTSRLTTQAKNRLTSVFNNIVETVRRLTP